MYPLRRETHRLVPAHCCSAVLHSSARCVLLDAHDIQASLRKNKVDMLKSGTAIEATSNWFSSLQLLDGHLRNILFRTLVLACSLPNEEARSHFVLPEVQHLGVHVWRSWRRIPQAPENGPRIRPREGR